MDNKTDDQISLENLKTLGGFFLGCALIIGACLLAAYISPYISPYHAEPITFNSK